MSDSIDSRTTFPLLVAFAGGRVQHAARVAMDGVRVATACKKRGMPVGDGQGMPFCAKCNAVPNPIDSRTYVPAAD